MVRLALQTIAERPGCFSAVVDRKDDENSLIMHRATKLGSCHSSLRFVNELLASAHYKQAGASIV